jgi:5'-deoxynucleotidase YfbR-like HD superfamily hydrolase
MKRPDISRLIELQRLALQFQAIERHVCYTSDELDRAENDVEHSYALALVAWFLCEHFTELDRDTVMRYALAHDLVEVYAGDTSVFADGEKLASKAEREAQALMQLSNEWPDFPDLLSCISEYEARANDEAKFVYSLDKIMPIILNYSQDGRGWRKHNITLRQLHETKKVKVQTDPRISKYYDELYRLLVEAPELFGQAVRG